jgi:hypothetical protein
MRGVWRRYVSEGVTSVLDCLLTRFLTLSKIITLNGRYYDVIVASKGDKTLQNDYVKTGVTITLVLLR